jgi:RNA binding exosome subunit
MIQYLYFRTLSHATEDINKVKKAMSFITGQDVFKETIEKGYYGNSIVILELQIKKKREIDEFWRRMKSLGVVDEIIPLLDELVDEHGTLYLRFNKQEAYMERIAITTYGDAIAMRAKIKSYPMKKSRAIENFLKYIEEL